ncbi:MAG: hypothetical protein Q4B95_09050 [Lonepinella koalarum]|nr:hypothetical protein [Lonepinella koalarum]
MKLITNKLNEIYLSPNREFKIIATLHQKRYLFIFLIGVIILTYPLRLNILDIIKTEQTLNKIEEQKNKLEKANHLYQHLIEKERILRDKDHNLTYINEQIQDIATKHSLTIQHLQWNLEQGKMIELNIIGNTNSLFTFLNELNQFTHIRFNNITLTKLEEERKLQLNTILVITNKE